MYKKVSRLELRFFISAHHLIMLYILPSFTRISKRVSELLGGHYFPTKIGEGAQAHQKYRRINGPYSLLITWWCFIFIPSIMKVSQKVSQLLSRHISQIKFSKGHDSVKIVGEVTKVGRKTLRNCLNCVQDLIQDTSWEKEQHKKTPS